jgi:hypothetical protein
MVRKTKEAFLWIIKILHDNKIPYRISGGFAAKIYGSPRKLRDIDIEIPDKFFKKLIPIIREYVTNGPKKFIDSKMKTYGLVMRYKGQIIEFSGTDSELLFDYKNKKWVNLSVDISKITLKNIYGKRVRVISKIDLLEYKKLIKSRKSDIIDIRALER